MKENRSLIQIQLDAEKQKAKQLLNDDDDEIAFTSGLMLTTCIRRADNAFKNRDYIQCKGILMALQEQYPFINNTKSNTWEQQSLDWSGMTKGLPETLETLLKKIETVDLNQSIQAVEKKPKDKRVGFFGKLFGVVNPSKIDVRALEGYDDANLNARLKPPVQPVVDTIQFQQLSFDDIRRVSNEYSKKPAFQVAASSPDFVPTDCNMVTQGYTFNINNSSTWVAVKKNGTPEHSQEEAFGWKFHVGIDEEPKNLQKGMDIVVGVLMKHQVADFKLAKPSIYTMNDSMQAGKQVTIYYELDRDKDWKTILEDIQHSLEEAGVKPTPRMAQSEKALGTSKFIGYRNDKDISGGYVDASDTTSYNASGKPDPFLHVLAEQPKASTKPR